MEYLVMETHPAYAVVLDEAGGLLKTANFGYAVGDTVTGVLPMKTAPGPAPVWKKLALPMAAAACLCLLYFGAYRPNFVPYGTVRMTINPDVLLTLSRTGRVLSAEGLNGDGKALLQGCAVSGENDLDTAEALMQRASGQGYLKDGGTVKLDVTSPNADWAEKLGRNLSEAMDGGVKGKTVTISIDYDGIDGPELILFTQNGVHRVYTYDEWLLQQQKIRQGGAAQSGPQDVEQWGEETGDAFENWGESVGDRYERWGESVGDIFDDGFNAGDLNSLGEKLKELFH